MNISQLLLEHFDHLLATPDSVERLNQAILELAVRGKLTRQDSNDEPASELLKRIKAEKARMVEESEIAKSKPLPLVHDDEKSIALPEGWEWIRLDSILIELQTGPFGSNLHKSDYVDGGIPVVNPSNMQNGRIVANPEMTISEETRQRLSQYTLQVGDVVVARRGEMGRCALVTKKEAGWLCGTGSLRMQLSDHLSKDYILRLFQTELARSHLVEGSVGITMSNLGQDTLLRLPIALPPLAEQHRIVARVEQLFAQTRQLAELLSKAQTDLTHLNAAALHHLLAADTPADFNARWDFIAAHFDLLYSEPEHIAPLRQAILELAVRGNLTRQDASDEPASELLKRIQAEKARLVETGELRESATRSAIGKDEKSFELPEGWAWARFGDVTINRDGERIPVAKEDRESRQGEYDYYGASGVIDKVDSYLFDKSLLLIGEDGANLINRSTPIAFIAHGKYWVNNHAHVLDAIDFAVLKYLEVYINAIDLKPYITGTAQPKMNQAKMNSIVVAVPPVAEQQRIVTRVEQLLGACDALEAKLQAAQVEREKLVAAVVAGVSDPHPGHLPPSGGLPARERE